MGNVLVGKIVHNVRIAADKEALLFITNEGEIIARCDADCCSYTWIESVEMPALGLPFQVTGVEDLEMPDLGDLPDCDVVAYYGLKISTTKGDMVIDYRNDSNGYYGGTIVWPGEGFYGGVYGQNVSNEEWREIEE